MVRASYQVPPGRLSLETFQVHPNGSSGVDPEHTGDITYLIWPGEASGSPRQSWKMCLERGMS